MPGSSESVTSVFYSYTVWQLRILRFTARGSASSLILLLIVKLAKSLNSISCRYYQPKESQGSTKVLQLWLFLLVPHIGKCFCQKPWFCCCCCLVWLPFSSDHATPVRCFCMQVKSLSLYVVFPSLGESRKLKQLVNIWKITENILQQCSVLNILRMLICHG